MIATAVAVRDLRPDDWPEVSRIFAEGTVTLQTGVFPENHASLALLTRFGFRVLGTQERIGRLHGVWRDVVLLERRSEVVT